MLATSSNSFSSVEIQSIRDDDDIRTILYLQNWLFIYWLNTLFLLFAQHTHTRIERFILDITSLLLPVVTLLKSHDERRNNKKI